MNPDNQTIANLPEARSAFVTWVKSRWQRGLLVVGLALSGSAFTLLFFIKASDHIDAIIQFAGSNERLQRLLPTANEESFNDAKNIIALDMVAVAGISLLLCAITSLGWRNLTDLPFGRHKRTAIGLPIGALAITIAGGLLELNSLELEQGHLSYSSTFSALLVSTAAWFKAGGLLFSIVTTLVAFPAFAARWIDPIAHAPAHLLNAVRSRGRDRSHSVPGTTASHQPGTVPDQTPRANNLIDEDLAGPGPGDVGLCCSGGGIRSTAFSLGAMTTLDRCRLIHGARYIAGVSGGSFAATSWVMVNSSGTADPAEAVVKHLRGKIDGENTNSRHQYLANGRGGLGQPIMLGILAMFANLIGLASLSFLYAWPIGWVIGSPIAYPEFRNGTKLLPDRLSIAPAMWLPGVILVGLALLLLITSVTMKPSHAGAAVRLSQLLLAAGIFLLTVLNLMPLALLYGVGFLRGENDVTGIVSSSVIPFLIVVLVAWQLVRAPVVTRFRRVLPRLGGLLLVFAALMWSGKIATDAASNFGLFSSPYAWLIDAVVFLVFYLFLNGSQTSLQAVYRRQLRRTFALRPGVDGLRPVSPGEFRLDQLPARPDLLICCTTQLNRVDEQSGLRARSLTISRDTIQIGGEKVPVDEYMASLPRGYDGYRDVATWMSVSGAAFASAMGRFGLGSTNALLAACNFNLGVWIPSPRKVGQLLAEREPNASRTGFSNCFPRAGWDYRFKEIMGWYYLENDYIFVTDGGHWENLGLVELLRRRCSTIICLDASADLAGSFRTLRTAAGLAKLELGDVVEDVSLKNLRGITAKKGALPAGMVTKLEVKYKPSADGSEVTDGAIYYAKAQVSSGSELRIQQYAAGDPRFPNYPTANQLLTDEEFDHLIDLGAEAGAEILHQIRRDKEQILR